jgi:hypothetical protein
MSPSPVLPVAARPGAFAEIQWTDLVPRAWDPTKRYRALKLDALKDNDPRAEALLRAMQSTWDNAPTVGGLANARVALSGYVVPLDGQSGPAKEFLLVPYFGACIHSPPPPANQIVHVIVQSPRAVLHVMDRVQVSGVLLPWRHKSSMGASGYRLSAVGVAPCESEPSCQASQ